MKKLLFIMSIFLSFSPNADASDLRGDFTATLEDLKGVASKHSSLSAVETDPYGPVLSWSNERGGVNIFNDDPSVPVDALVTDMKGALSLDRVNNLEINHCIMYLGTGLKEIAEMDLKNLRFLDLNVFYVSSGKDIPAHKESVEKLFASYHGLKVRLGMYAVWDSQYKGPDMTLAEFTID